MDEIPLSLGVGISREDDRRSRAADHLLYPVQFRKALVNPLLAISAILMAVLSCSILPKGETTAPESVSRISEDWQEDFGITGRKLSSRGEAKYFILEPGFQLILTSQNAELIITVLDETRDINGITTRVVEEREFTGDELYEVSRNFYAMDQATGDAFYFGEEVDFYTNGEVVGHSGAWIAFQDGNQPGLIMPGAPEAGMKYYQELAPGVAMDRARVVSVSETFTTAIGEFENCLLTQESSKIEPVAMEYKTYCPGIGLVQDQSLILSGYGY